MKKINFLFIPILILQFDTYSIKLPSIFNFLKNIKSMEIIENGGTDSKPILITTKENQRYILKKIEKKRDNALYLIAFNLHLKKKRIPVARFYGLKEPLLDSYIIQIGDEEYVLMDYLKGKSISEEQLSFENIYDMAKIAVEIQNAVRDFHPKKIRRFLTREEILKNIPNLKYDSYFNDIKFIKMQYEIFMKHWSLLKKYFVISHIHNDLHTGNMRFSAKGKVSGLFDIDYAQQDYRIGEFRALVLGKRHEFKKQRFFEILKIYQAQLSIQNSLSYLEILGIIEIFRYSFLELTYFIVSTNQHFFREKMDYFRNFTEEIKYLEKFMYAS